MKRILFILLIMVSFTSFAFELNFGENEKGENTVIYDSAEWDFIKKESNYNFYVNKGLYPTLKNGLKVFHSVVVFDEPLKLSGLDMKISKIYTFGYIHCARSIFVEAGEFYVNEKDDIVLHRKYEFGKEVINMNAPGTARHEALIAVCGKESI